MGAFWLTVANSQTHIGKDLTRLLPDSTEQSLFWNNIVDILKVAKEQTLDSRTYHMNLDRVSGQFSVSDLLLVTSRFILEQAKSFVEEAQGKDPNEIFNAAQHDLNANINPKMFKSIFFLMPVSKNILLDTAKKITTPEGKLAWAFVARSMTRYMREYFSDYLTPLK